MTAEDILKDLKNRKYKPLYLLHGEEPYYIDLVSNFVEHHLLPDAEKGFNQTVLYGKDTEIMTVQDVADYMHCHYSTIYRLIQRGALPVFRVGADYRFRRSEIDKWVKQQRA